MATIPRQLVDEILTKYELHPDLFDIYVEGDFDRDFLVQFLESTGIMGDVSVYAIDGVEITSERLEEFSLGYGSNKDRVLCLARILDQQLSHPAQNILCMVDADLDRLFGRLESLKYVKHTDYTCMEMYSLNEQAIRRFLQFTCNLDAPASTQFFQIALSVLPAQFCLRGAIEALGLGVPIPSFEGGLKVKRDLLSFSADKYFANLFIAIICALARMR